MVLCFFLSPANSLAGQANLAWDPPDISTDVTGYMIHYGTASGTYSQGIDVGNTTSYTVSNLMAGQTYYFAVTAYDAVGYQSIYSNEVSIMISPPQYLLLTLNPGPGQGTVSGPGISCGDTCLAVYNPGTVVSLSATADPGSTFDGWSGGECSGTGLCTATMNANTTITANFKTSMVSTTSTTSIPPTTSTTYVTTTSSATSVPATTFSLTISKPGNGSGTVTSLPSWINCGLTCSASFAGWTSVTLAATPDPGSTFTGWSGGVCSGTSTTCQVTIDGNKTVTATFATAGTALYFPHVDTSLPWQTEIAIINTSPDQTVTGTLRALSDEGQLIETKDVTLSARGRRQITIADEFTNHTDIGYITFDTDSATVQGYTKFYQAGIYRAAIPAVKEVNTSDIYISHIDSSAQWWTGVSLVNTTSATKELTITFNNGQSVPYTLNANEHKAFTIGNLLNQPLQPDIRSAVITNASGIIGLELFGSTVGGNQMNGILLTDKTASTIYYPHVANDGWWTGIVAYNPSESACTITITPYSAQRTPLSSSTLSIAGKGKYIGTVTDLGLPAQTAWFKIDSTRPLSGFELFGTADGNQLVAYAGGGGTGAKEGVFAKIEKNGWTGIAFVNTEAGAASVTLTAYNDNGTAVATQGLLVGGHAKVVNFAEAIFWQDIRSATYIAYSSDRNVVGFQLNGSSDGMMLDGLPGLGGTN